MKPDEVLAMPTRLFFALERQINRVRAEQDMRHLAVVTSAASGASAHATYQNLSAEQGEVYTIGASNRGIVEREEGALEKLQSFLGG